MDLNQMLIFSKVAENQSFTKAAADLHIEKSTVSTKISQLETRLGARLLNRTTRSVTLTEAGEGYFQYCQQIVETALEAEQFTSTLSHDALGLLRISLSTDFAQLFIRKLIQPFMLENPQVKIELILQNQLVNLVKDRIDVALRIGRGQLDDSTLIAKKIIEVEIAMFASPEYIKKNGNPKSFEDLNQFEFIEFSMGETFTIPIKCEKKSLLLKPKGRFKVNDMLAAKEAALAGLGLVILPSIITRDEVENNLLVPLLSHCEFQKFNLFAVFPSRQWMPAKLSSFLAYLEKLESY